MTLVTTLKPFTATYSSATTSTLVYTIASSFTLPTSFTVTAGGASITSSLSGSTLTLTGLVAGRSYTPVIAASGWSPATLTARSTTSAFTITQPTSSDIGATTVSLQLTPSGDTVLPGSSSDWTITYTNGVNTFYVTYGNISFNTSTNLLTLSNLSEYTQYTFEIAPTGVPSQSITLTTADITAPGSITGFAATVNADSIVLSWTPITDSGSAISYEIAMNSGAPITTNTATYTFSSLTAGTTYNFNIRAVDAAGNQGSHYNTAALTPYGDSPALAIAGGKTIAQYITDSAAAPATIAVDALVAVKETYADDSEREAAFDAAIGALTARVLAEDPTATFLSLSTMGEAAALLDGNTTYLEGPREVIMPLGEDVAFADLDADNEGKYLYFKLPKRITLPGDNWVQFAANNTYTTSASASPVPFDVSTVIVVSGYSFMVHGRGSVLVTGSSTGVKCFLANAPVLTPGGYKPISTIAEGDFVTTTDGRAVPVRAVKVTRYAPSTETCPFVIKQGMWGAMEDLMISPNHRVAVGGGQMVEAKRLGLKQAKMRDTITYYNLQLPNWHTDNMVVAGVAVESMAPATQRRTVPAAQFMALLKRTYGTITETHLRQIRARCKLLPNGMVEFPCMEIGQ